MANELVLSSNGNYSNTGDTASPIPMSMTITVGSRLKVYGTQLIGTSEEVLIKGEITTIGMVRVKNLDATNYVQFGSATTVYCPKVKAGEWAVFRIDATNCYAKSNTAACYCYYEIWE
jgi:hypothetical protein